MHAAQSKTRRVQMELSPSSFDRLNKVKDLLEASSYTEVMKDALRLLEYVAEEDTEGSKFFIKRKDGEISEVKILT